MFLTATVCVSIEKFFLDSNNFVFYIKLFTHELGRWQGYRPSGVGGQCTVVHNYCDPWVDDFELELFWMTYILKMDLFALGCSVGPLLKIDAKQVYVYTNVVSLLFELDWPCDNSCKTEQNSLGFNGQFALYSKK